MATVTTGWAAIARKEAPVEKKPDIQSMLSTAGLKTVVVDANAIIGNARLSGIADQFFTVKEVLAEVRDPASRFHLATLPLEIKCLEPSEEALMKVAQFARATGDVQSLSDVDMKIIALTYTLEAEVHGTDHIRNRPPPLVLTAAKGGQRTNDPPGWGRVSNPEEWEGIEDEGDGANTGSRILGLKSLSLDTLQTSSARDNVGGPNSENEVIVNSTVVHHPEGSASTPAEVHKSAPLVSENREKTLEKTLQGVVDVEPTQLEHVVDSAGARDSKSDRTTPVEVDKSGRVASTNHEETNQGTVNGENTQNERLRATDSNTIPDTVAGARNPLETKQVSQGEANADGDEWQRAVCRSTRRQYLKRVERRALRHLIAESLAPSESQDTENKEPKELISSQEPSDEGSTLVNRVFCSDACDGVGETEHGGQLDYRGSDNGLDAVELIKEGLYEDEAEIDEAESVDDESRYHDDTASNADAASSVDTQESLSVIPMWTSTVACMTGDFAMQNVILQMGLRLLSPSGHHVKELNKWVLKCQACFKVTTQTDRLFCPKCGNGGTLYKVSITVGPNGCLLAGRNRRPILRGTRYSLPLPKGGREGALVNPILREDQLPAKPRKVKKPEFETFSSSDVVFTHPHERKGQKGAGVKLAAALFSGRRNPNERRRSLK